MVATCVLVGGVFPLLLRRAPPRTRQYLWPWLRGVGVQSLVEGLVAQFMFNCCIDQNYPQVAVLAAVLAVTAVTQTR